MSDTKEYCNSKIVDGSEVQNEALYECGVDEFSKFTFLSSMLFIFHAYRLSALKLKRLKLRGLLHFIFQYSDYTNLTMLFAG